MNKNKKFLIATGGTGGHVIPALNLAKHLKEKKFTIDIISDKRGLHFFNKNEDLNIKVINTSTFFGKSFLKIFKSIFVILLSIFKSLKFLVKNKPNLVFGMGGYSSFPICLASRILGIPYILYENNLLLGKTNRFLLNGSRKIFVSYSELKGIKKKFENKIIVIGNIVRKEILDYKYNRISENKINILIIGGSQAAKSFAEKLPLIFKECVKNNINLRVTQQCLPEQKKELEIFYKKNNINFSLFTYTHEIFNFFSKANLVITRSGSSISSELINCNIPFISIPLPTSANNHQYLNAEYFKNKGLCFLIEEKYISTKLLPLLNSIHIDKSILDKIVKKQNSCSDKLVYEKIDKEILNIFDEKN